MEASLEAHAPHLLRESKASQLNHFFDRGDEQEAEEDGPENWKKTFLHRLKDPLGCVQKLRERMLVLADTQGDTKKKGKAGEKAAAKAAEITASTETIPGWRVIQATTFDWRNIESKSRSRDFETYARAAIVEERRMYKYLKPIVATTPVAHFRRLLADKLAESVSLKYEGGKAMYKYSFYDGFEPDDISTVPQLQDLSSADRLASVKAAALKQDLIKELRRIFRIIHDSPVAKFDNAAKGNLEANVRDALDALKPVGLSLIIYYFLSTLMDMFEGSH
jgi:hypothetical protein